MCVCVIIIMKHVFQKYLMAWANDEIHIPVRVGRQKVRGDTIGIRCFRIHSISVEKEKFMNHIIVCMGYVHPIYSKIFTVMVKVKVYAHP